MLCVISWTYMTTEIWNGIRASWYDRQTFAVISTSTRARCERSKDRLDKQALTVKQQHQRVMVLISCGVYYTIRISTFLPKYCCADVRTYVHTYVARSDGRARSRPSRRVIGSTCAPALRVKVHRCHVTPRRQWKSFIPINANSKCFCSCNCSLCAANGIVVVL